jgi:FG-GAP-like repeat
VVMPCPAPCFNFAGPSAGWFLPTKLRSADFDGDGMDDLVLLAARDSSNTRSSVTFFRSNSNGLFSTAVNHPLTSPPNTITGDELAIANLNGDAAPDVIAKNVFDSPANAAVFLNPGNTMFPAPDDFATLIDPKSIAVGDLDGDTFPDFAVVGDSVLRVYPGDGPGSFGVPSQPIALHPDWFLLDVRLGDVDDDGDLDLVLLDSAALIVSLNNGTGGYAPPVAKSITYEDNGVELADVNGDGRADVITVINSSDGGFCVYRSLGNGQLSDPVFTSLASGQSNSLVQDFVLGDLNEDGLPDLVFAEYLNNAVHIWLSQGDGRFKPRKKGPLFTPAKRPPLTLALGDFNGDGKPDLAAGVLMLNQIWTWLKE